MNTSQTNGTGQEPPITIAILKAMEAMARAGKAITELRIHPDDWAKLRLEMKPYEMPETFGPGQTWPPTAFGLKVVVDELADRMTNRKELP